MKLNLLHYLPTLSDNLSPRSLSQPTYWNCTAHAPLAPGLTGLQTIQAVFTALYGTEPLTLQAEEARVATCGGLLFGLWNGHPHSVTEKPNFRDWVAEQDPGSKGTECLGDADDEDSLADDLKLSYMFGFGQDSWVTGGLTEIRRCEN
ncbi:uncharacterized protein CTRU02_206277 [Colletotrichum truncatum]|uniref:Uncharacterized protein n=1 Tax=Colletotrichum truncatum TaxID=5467 RepID=A0ACC3Z6D1_COLTU|nr:uncharacterized protein CTRU02_09884 [Colletotrichum truncatum]KAF6788071.1 hypothetical protein CTRU02_09884 [Colletotrichum truncatum]